MSVQEQAMQMISGLLDDNVIYLIDFMRRFMMPKDESNNKVSVIENTGDTDFMQEMEAMRIKTKSYISRLSFVS